MHFLGNFPHDQFPLFYNLCEIFIMASRSIEEQNDVEGFGVVFLEANACGTPVIGGRSGGVPDAIDDGKTGLLVDPQSSDDIARAILELLKNPERCRAMSNAGKQWVKEKMNWERAVETIRTATSFLV